MGSMDEPTVQRLIREATTPLEAELRDLRAQIADLRTRLGVTPTAPSGMTAPLSSSPAAPLEPDDEPSSPEPPAPTEVPAERTDFMRFIQRGLEQEEREYAKEPEPAKPEKKGWNPFKR
jgi:hypothetical protein